MYEILAKEALAPVIKLMVIPAPDVARKAKAGQFVIVRPSEEGERIPLTIADRDPGKGTITIVFQEVGKTTMLLGTLEVDDRLASLTGPLGNPTETDHYGTVVCVGGGVGIACIYPVTRALKEAGNHTISIIGARTKELLIWEDRIHSVSDEVIVCTDDGSYGRKALVTEPLKELLEEVRESMGSLLDGVQFIVDPDLPTVLGIRSRVEEIFSNLIQNAIKFNDKPVPRIEIGCKGLDGGHYIIYVKDNGIGIKEDYYDKIFQIFQKLDPKAEGTGAGLAICRRIVEEHGGRIWVESQVGEGSTFYFTLPKAPAAVRMEEGYVH